MVKNKNFNVHLHTFTPEEAEQILLERNVDNYRDLKPSAKKFYVNEMKEGNWMFNGDTIRFDTKGHLLDGQHRLEAIKESGIPQEFIVVEDLDPECSKTIDIGFKKSVEDYLNHFEKMYKKGAAAVVKQAISLSRGNITVGNSQVSQRISNTLIIDTYKKDDKHFLEANSFGKEISNISKKVLKPSIVGAIYYHLVYTLRYDIGKVRLFFAKLSAYSTTENSIFTTTYERLGELDGRSRCSVIPIIIRCWNSFAKGNTKRLISESECSKTFDSPDKKEVKIAATTIA